MRMSRPYVAQLESPDDVSPMTASWSPILATAGPPESPTHVCDGAGRKRKSSSVYEVMAVVPERLRRFCVASGPVAPKPMSRISRPMYESSNSFTKTLSGATGAVAARPTTAMSFTSVSSSKSGCTRDVVTLMKVPFFFDGSEPK